MLDYLITSTASRAARPRASVALHFNADATVAAIDPVWLVSVERRINSLLMLRENWDSAGASRIDFEAAMGALVFLVQNALHEMPAPDVTPMSNGGVQIEWHIGATDLELAFAPSEPSTFFFSDGSDEKEGEIEQELLVVEALMRGLPLQDERLAHCR